MKYFDEIFTNKDSEIPSDFLNEQNPLIIDDEVQKAESGQSQESEVSKSTKELADPDDIAVGDEEGEKSIKVDKEEDDTWGYLIGNVTGMVFSEWGMGALGLWWIKRSVTNAISSKVTESVTSSFLSNSSAVNTLRNGTYLAKRGIISKLFGSIKGGFSSFFSGSSASQLSMFSGPTSSGGFLASIGAAIKTKVLAVVSTVGFKVAVVAAVVIWGVLYLMGDLSMEELLDIWKSGEFQEKSDDPDLDEFNTNIYKATAGGLMSAKGCGPKFLNDINKKFEDKGKVTIRLRNSKESVEENAEAYLDMYKVLVEELEDVPVMTDVLNSKTEEDMIDKIKGQYKGLNVSGRDDKEDYDLIRAYVTKNMLENDDSPNNPYGISIAEEAEGWYSTAFDTFIPGMNELGWADWMLSDTYLNNINNLTSLKSREWLYTVVNSYWIAQVDDLNGSTFTIKQFGRMSEFILGNGFLKRNLKVFKSLEYGVVDDEGKYERLGSFTDLLREGGQYVTDILIKTARSDKKIPVTNVTVSFGLMHLSFVLLYLLYEGLTIQIALLQIGQGVNGAEKKVLEEYGVDDEYESGDVVTGKETEKERRKKKEESQKEKEKQSKPTEDEIEKKAEDVIETFKEMPNLQGFEG